ncbi:hypothetical protein [Leifsonia sp. NPDC058230]|uniref:hypothetical protein n=1 Tax=Leifsonia sp. NPDC058230 TaxID=3346391 RepID=UPI0036DF6ECF
MRVMTQGERVWLVLDDGLQIRYQIECWLAAQQDTHESLMMYRVDHWALNRAQRWPLGFYDELSPALDACALALGMPNFLTSVTASDGTIITPEEQRATWRACSDPRAGRCDR